MEAQSLYEIDLKDVALAQEGRQWHLDDGFFAALEGTEIEHGDLDVALRVKKTSGTYELTFSIEGQVRVPCDRCLELMQQDVDTEQTLRVRLGESYDDDGDFITVPEDEGTFNCAWNLYEMIALALPIHHVHPEGQCSTDMQTLLERHSAAGSTDPSDIDTTAPKGDSPWEVLRKLRLDEHEGEQSNKQ